ncbi:hypothetical protein JYT87_03520, partial [Nitrospira defluvii]|nr:hypothetical protein [Nitrospira defluvii]
MNQDINTSQDPPSVGGTGIDLGFGGLSVAEGDHIGHFYRNQEEMIRVLVPYFIAGLGAGDKCTLFCQAPTR